jgi:hypothetical protein
MELVMIEHVALLLQSFHLCNQSLFGQMFVVRDVDDPATDHASPLYPAPDKLTIPDA